MHFTRRPTFGLIFLFKYREEKDHRPVLHDAPGVFFAKQIINNACATQAIVSILMNRPDISLGPVLENYRSFAVLSRSRAPARV
jgi:ubiquitin carboxyl-terminal hydrolase L5